MNQKKKERRWVPGLWRNGARVNSRPPMSVGMINAIASHIKTAEELKKVAVYL